MHKCKIVNIFGFIQNYLNKHNINYNKYNQCIINIKYDKTSGLDKYALNI